MSFTHRSPGPVANVETLLPGKDDLLIPSDACQRFRRAPPIRYINQENGVVHHGVEGIFKQIACFPLLR